jgi:hypothetical protein
MSQEERNEEEEERRRGGSVRCENASGSYSGSCFFSSDASPKA